MLNKIIYPGLIFILAFSIGCNDEKPQLEPQAQPEVSEFQVKINHQFGEDSFKLNQEYTLASQELVKYSRISYILSNFYLIQEDSSIFNIDDSYMLVDLKNTENIIQFDSVPIGNYLGIGFSIGLDSATNHGNPNLYAANHPLSPINNSLHWSWQGGYIFSAIEGKTILNKSSFSFHLAGINNKIDVELPYRFSKKEAKLIATMTYHVNEIFDGPSVYNIETDGASTHNTESPATKKLIQNMKNNLFLLENIK